MKVIGINGSARKGGNTSIVMNEVFKPLKNAGIETELIELADVTMESCSACWGCAGKQNCIRHQDAFQGVFHAMLKADGILLGSPVYTGNITSSMQAFLERCGVVTDLNKGLLKHKVGACVSVARRAGSMSALDTLQHFFLTQDMFLVGSSYWNMAYGQLPGDVVNDHEAMETMRNLGENMVFLLKSLHTSH